MTHQERISDRLAIVVLNFRQWTGETVLDKEDFQLGQGGKLPPEHVAHLGSKRICNPDELRVFASIKQRAVRLLESCGVPYLGGWAVPLSQAKKVLLTLDTYVREYEVAKATFLQRYDEAVKAWIAQNPEFGSEILRSVKTKSHVEARIRSGYSVFKVQALEGDANSFDLAEAGLGETLLTEVAKTARELYRRTFAGKDQVTARAVDPIRRIRARLAGLAFIDNGILPVINAIDNALSPLSKYGPYKGSDFHQLTSIVLVLCDEDRMRDLSQAVTEQVSSQSAEDFALMAEDPQSSLSVSVQHQDAPEVVPSQGQKQHGRDQDLSLDLDAELEAFLEAKKSERSQKSQISQKSQTDAHRETQTPVRDLNAQTLNETHETNEINKTHVEHHQEGNEYEESKEPTPLLPSMTQDNASSMFW